MPVFSHASSSPCSVRPFRFAIARYCSGPLPVLALMLSMYALYVTRSAPSCRLVPVDNKWCPGPTLRREGCSAPAVDAAGVRRSVAYGRVGPELADLLCTAAGGGDLGGPLQRLIG